jgi:hypothetical protein
VVWCCGCGRPELHGRDPGVWCRPLWLGM